MKRIIPAIFSVSFIIASLVLSVNAVGYKAIPDAYANTNAAALATISANDTKVSSATTSTGGLETKKVNYFDDVSGYLVYPSAANTTGNNKLPAIIMIHEWWGLNDNIKSMANTLAKQGNYAVLGIDLFKGKLTKDPNQAMQQVKSVTDKPSEAISNMQAE
jgi:carboxymethylenebutenolidase